MSNLLTLGWGLVFVLLRHSARSVKPILWVHIILQGFTLDELAAFLLLAK